jgi:hypothetical protein
MFKVEYDDTKRRCIRKNVELSAALAEKIFNRAYRGAEALVEI